MLHYPHENTFLCATKRYQKNIPKSKIHESKMFISTISFEKFFDHKEKTFNVDRKNVKNKF